MFHRMGEHPAECRKRIQLINTFRKLWSQHVMWTRAFIISTAAGLGDLQAVTKRLLRNAPDFSAELRRYYGNDAVRRFEQLFTGHLTIAAQLVNAAKAENAQAAEEARKKWYRNADELAAFFAAANPYWNRKKWQSLLYSHLKMTEQEATERLAGHYEADIALYDRIEAEALEMADYMAQGIEKQFPF